jgi:hypothetical protein
MIDTLRRIGEARRLLHRAVWQQPASQPSAWHDLLAWRP